MSAAIVVWVLLPMAVGAAAAFASLYAALRRPCPFQIVAAVVALAGIAWSEWVLLQIVRGAWPTFLPHIVIVLSLPLVLLQVLRASSNAA